MSGILVIARVVLVATAMGISLAACSSWPTTALFAPTASSSGLSASTAGHLSSPDPALLAEMRHATARFHSIDAAFAAGYVDDGFGCIDAADFGLDPSLGGMGFHLINESLHADPETDPLRPDLLVYEPQPGGQPRLVALEWEVFREDWFGAGHSSPPTLLGQEFESLDFGDIHVFALHVWLWRDNPSGMFEDFNPKVTCP